MILLSVLLAQAAMRLLPVDEARRDPSFVRFRSALIRAIDRGDHAAVFRATEPNVKLGFGIDNGMGHFRRVWRRDRTYRQELRRVLSLGGGWITDGGKPMFLAPYYAAKFPEGRDPFEFGVIVGSRVPLKARPDAKSRTLATLSYDLVRAGGEPIRNGWSKVETLKGISGYVSERMHGSPVGYRAGFRKVGGRWQMSFFLAGD